MGKWRSPASFSRAGSAGERPPRRSRFFPAAFSFIPDSKARFLTKAGQRDRVKLLKIDARPV